ncbi:MAG TPA: single-stranded-DNA-specific exonuclease RecJ [Caldimonas sp.]|jgi:single-stranded-DNA-specific exonuclease|nr:single-stranded-DNA-specific exonuclease RecJ [Caldimonas sp.]HEX4233836.1 single-stranded-DNA-specific exonuclease RecJ [Caldimonas sp.]
MATEMAPIRLVTRDVPPRTAWALEQAGLHPLLARLFAARGVKGADELDDALARLLSPATLLGAGDAAVLLADAIGAGSRICVVADYDCDGATACAVTLRGLRMLGADPATLCYVVPDRRVHGYGLTPQIVDLALAQSAEVLMTVDNGIASLEGVAHASAAGLAVVITDHHLPLQGDGGAVLPEADVIVDPNQPGCGFASKHLAGVGVAFYVLLALRAELRERGDFTLADQPRLDALLDLVALGTVADVVRLDRNNRCLVAQGVKRIRAGRMQSGVAALFAVAERDPRQASAADFGFAIGPRLNAAGRLADMTLGIECLLTDDAARAHELAALLDEINRERRTLEAGMREDAEAEVERAFALSGTLEPALAVFDPSFHEGVVGIIASRLKDRLHRPTFVFARGQDGALKGSGRSIEGFHLRDALDLVSKRHPGLLLRFGGHAMAAGCTLAAADLDTFRSALQQAAAEALGTSAVEQTIVSDGPLAAAHFDPATVRLLDGQIWGNAFDAPLFSDTVDVVSQRLVGDKHLKLALRVEGVMRDAIWFGRSDPVGDRVRVAWRLGLDAYNGVERVQMIVVAVEEGSP